MYGPMIAKIAPPARQPREHPVPCQGCGLNPRTGAPVRQTLNLSALCLKCEAGR